MSVMGNFKSSVVPYMLAASTALGGCATQSNYGTDSSSAYKGAGSYVINPQACHQLQHMRNQRDHSNSLFHDVVLKPEGLGETVHAVDARANFNANMNRLENECDALTAYKQLPVCSTTSSYQMQSAFVNGQALSNTSGTYGENRNCRQDKVQGGNLGGTLPDPTAYPYNLH